MKRTIGTCSHCGGRVSTPIAYLSVVPPIPSCESCGRHVASPHGPVVKTVRSADVEGWTKAWLRNQVVEG